MRDSMPKFLKKFANFFKGVWISYTIKAIRGHFSAPNSLWRSETNSLYFRCCCCLLLFFYFVVWKGFWLCVTMSSCGGHRAGSGQIVIQSPQESKRKAVKIPIQHLQWRETFKTWICEKFDVWCNLSASCFTITKDRGLSSYMYFISSKSLECQRPAHHPLLITHLLSSC